jgi:hypothetical protein
MTPRRLARLVACVGWWCLAAAGCLLYTDTINVPPVVTIDGPERVARGEPARFTARVADGSQGGFTVEWWTSPECPSDKAAALALSTGDGATKGARSREPFVHRAGHPYCVWALVTDAQGAQGFAARMVAVTAWAARVTGPAVVNRGEPAIFKAQVTGDPAPGRPRFEWHQGTACPGDLTAARLMTSVVGVASGGPACPGETCAIEVKDRAPSCVWVVVVDDLMIAELATLPLPRPQNRAPVARLAIKDVRGLAKDPPYGLMTRFRASAAGSEDPDKDPLAATFTLTHPDGSTSTPGPCPDAPAVSTDVCFTTPQPGMYALAATVADDEGARAAATPIALPVADLYPCIVPGQTEPRYTDAPKSFWPHDQPRTFAVGQVEDDADPYPPRSPGASFVWRIGTGKTGPLQRLVGAQLETLTIEPRRYRPGDVARVRVEYLDRVDVADPNARPRPTCDHDAPVCEVRKGCYLWLTWTVEYL